MADILSIGGSGLTAYRQSLEAIGNNITNANTDGYSRRDATLKAVGTANESPISANTGSGSGVAVELITRSSDNFVQAEARQATSAASQASALADRLNNLQTTLFSANNDLGTAVQGFFNTVQDFATEPTSIPVRTTMLQSADALATSFNTQAATLSQESQSTLSDMNDTLNSTNALTKQLDTINKQLNSLSNSSGATNDLLDQRDAVVNQIVGLTGVTVQTLPSGAINLFLGGSTGGPELVGPNGAKPLSASRGTDGSIGVVMDPYGSAIPIATISGGTAGGILAYDDQVTACTNQLNSLATGLSAALNQQHMKGVDLNGNPGQPLFATSNLAVVAAPNNKGTGSASISVTDPSKIGNGTYTAVYNANTAAWTVTNSQTKVAVVGQNSVSIDGMNLNFTGTSADGDTLQFSPLSNAAAGMHVLIQDPNQLAGALPQLAQSSTSNTGSSAITLQTTNSPVALPSIPQMSDVFTQSLSPSAALGIHANGVVASVPSGSSNVTLSSLANISAATFVTGTGSGQLDPQAVLAHTPTTLNLQVNSGAPQSITLFPNGAPPTPNSQLDATTQVVNEINRALSGANLSNTLFASANNGTITINALGKNSANASGVNEINSASIKLSTQSVPTYAAVEAPSPASDIEILTTEGQQIAGQPLSGTDLTKLMTTANGFSNQAVYAQVPSGSLYRGIAVATTSSPLNQTTTTNSVTNTQSANLLVNVVPQTDSPYIGSNSVPHAGAVYSLAIAGIATPLRLAGNAIAGQDSQAISTAFVSEIAAQMPQISVKGQAISLGVPQKVLSGQAVNLSVADGLKTASFTVAVDGTSYPVTFQRNTASDGTLLPSGTFTVTGNPDLKLSLNDVVPATTPPSQAVSIALTTATSTASPSIVVSGAGATALGLGGTLNSVDTSASTFNVNVNGTSYPVTFNRATNADGSPATTGTFTVAGNANLSLKLNDVTPATLPPTQTVSVSLPSSPTSSPPVITFSGIGATLLGLAGPNQQTMVATQAAQVDANGQPLPATLNLMQSWTNPPSAISLNVTGTFGTQLAKDAQGNQINDASGNPVSISWSTNSDGMLVISSPKSSPALSFATTTMAERNAAVSLGFLGTDLSVSQSGPAQTSVGAIARQVDSQGNPVPETVGILQNWTVPPSSVNVTVTGAAGSQVLKDADGNSITDASGNPVSISWSTNSDGKLMLTAPLTSQTMSVDTTTQASRTAAAALGLAGTSLVFTKAGAGLQINSSITDRPAGEVLADTSGSVSRIGQSVTITGPVPEDLIIATNGAAGSARQLTAQFPTASTRVNPTMPDVNVTVTALGQISITDVATGSVLATRSYTTGQPISYMGSSFQIDGNANVGDSFNISTDLNRPNDNRNGLALANIQSANIFGPGASTFQDVYANEVGKVGAAAQAASTSASSTKTISDDLTAAYSAATGVNMDTEATNLIKIQQAYQACAQIVSTAREMFTTLLNSMGGA